MVEASSASGEAEEVPAGTPVEDPGTPADPDATPTEPTDAKSPGEPSAPDGTTEAKPEGEATDDAKGPQTLLEAVEAATEKKPDADPSSAQSEQEKVAADAKPEGEDADSKGEEEPPPFHEHPRWKALISERDVLTTERDELKTKYEAGQEDTEAVGRLQTFMQTQSLSVENVNELLAVGGQIRNDPAKALAAVNNLRDRLMDVLGHNMPEDLRRAVENGEITDEYAAQLSQSRSQGQLEAARSQRATETQAQQTTVQNTEAAAAAISAEAVAWDKTWQQSDPDYSLKQKRFLEKADLARFRGEFSQDPSTTRAKLTELRKDVETEMRAAQPKPKETKPTPSGGGSNSTTQVAEPKTLMEAMEAAAG